MRLNSRNIDMIISEENETRGVNATEEFAGLRLETLPPIWLLCFVIMFGNGLAILSVLR